MSGAGVEPGRSRPLSGGLWTLFSWLRRDDHSSSDSLSSVGSDRTAASFAFLGPRHYPAPQPLVIPPPGPPTDSYKKRVRDRNLRRQNDRDITLLRKYGLHGFDAFSLPNARRVASDRDRRAASEILNIRSHVPGKRRAPLPPSAPTSLNRPRARKRPAPQPPQHIQKENAASAVNETNTFPMNSRRLDKTLKQEETGCKPEKYSKKESKEPKLRQDKSFLKQIFENRKRHSAIETSSVKLLPSISELDKQAHEIIERYKLKELEHNALRDGGLDESAGSSKQPIEAWICTRCLRKYNASVITCLYCLPLENAILNNSKSSKVASSSTQTSINSQSGLEDKEKLKEILKEMKDSLPKKPTAGPTNFAKSKVTSEIETKGHPIKILEAPTLRIGSSISAETKAGTAAPTVPLTRDMENEKLNNPSERAKDEVLGTIENVLVTQPVVLVHTKANIVTVNNASTKEEEEKQKSSNPITRKVEKSNMTKTEIASKLLSGEKVISNVVTANAGNSKSDIATPLKVSSVLNPIYVPKSTNVTISSKEETESKNSLKDAIKATVSTNTENKVVPSTCLNKPTTIQPEQVKSEPKKIQLEQSTPRENIVIVKKIVETKRPIDKINDITASKEPKTSIVDKLDQHSRRRNLINQLEQSIAKGDEKAAAYAAVKLAQLRLSCSVLSFSSQIVSEASSSSTGTASTSALSKTDKPLTDASPKKYTPVVTEGAKLEKKNDDSNRAQKDTVVKEEPTQVTTYAANVRVVASEKSQTEKSAKALQTPVPSQPTTSKDIIVNKENNDDVPILVWVEDKEATRGPVQIHVKRGATLGELRRRAEAALGLAARMQRWIIGRALCSDDNTTLVALAGPELSAPFYLCLVQSDKKEPEKTGDAKPDDTAAGDVYNELVKLEQQAVVTNSDAFECGVCLEECAPGRGIVLRECVHSFCNECVSDVVRHSEEAVVACPATGCRGVIQEREIRGLVAPEEYEKWLARGLAVAENGTRNAFHCRTRDCVGWALCDPGVIRFPCPVCTRINCVPCQAIHEGDTCEQHRVKLLEATANESASHADEGTRALLDSLISRGEALECPECSAIITKKWGCDWIKCSACKTEICWVTRGRRWGPAGRGDTSGGCRCGVDGNKCHPSCGYCH